MRLDKIARPENISYKDKWCPFARTSYVEFGKQEVAAASINRLEDDDNPLFARCIGHHCMMFRGDAFGYNHNNDRTEPEHHPEYCGLVGKHPYT